MTRLCAVALVLLVGMAFAADVVVPEDIDLMLRDYHDAVVMGDIETAKAFLSPLAILQSHLAGMGKQGDVLRLGDTYALESLERKYVSCRVKDDRAAIVLDLLIKGIDKQTGDDKEEIWRRMESLRKEGTHWQIQSTALLDAEAEALMILEGTVVDEKNGIKMPVPKGWTPHIISGMGSRIMSVDAPDCSTAATIVAQELPIALTTQAIADMGDKTIALIGAASERQFAGDTTLGGKPAYRVRSTLSFEDATLYTEKILCIDSSEDEEMLYALVLASDREGALDEYKTQFDEIEKGICLTGREKQELPPEAGKVVDGKFLNPTYEVSMNIAEGWKAKVSRSRFLFQLIVRAPDSESTMLFAAVDIGQYLDPKIAVLGDMAAYREQDPNLQVITEGPLVIDKVAGYQMLSEMTLGDEGPRRRQQVFFSRGTRLYFALGEAVPATDYENVYKQWAEMVGSLKFGPIAEE